MLPHSSYELGDQWKMFLKFPYTSPSTEGQVGCLGSSPNLFKFDQETEISVLVKMFVLEEQSFWFVQNEGFWDLLNYTNKV